MFDNLARLAINDSRLRVYFQYTRELILRAVTDSRATSGKYITSGGGAPSRPRQWAHVAPHVFSTRMPNLTCIEYFCVDWTQIPLPPAFYICISRFTSVSQLKLSGCRFPSFSQVQRLARALPRVSTLELHGVTWDKPDALRKGNPYNDKPSLSSLTMRRLSRENFVSIVEWVNDTPSRDFLRVLRCLCDDRDRSSEGVNTTKLLEVLGPSLEDLSLDLTNWELTDSVPQTLAHSTNLHSLCIYFPTVLDRTHSLAVVTEMMSQISSKRFHRLVLNLQLLRWVDIYDYLPEDGEEVNNRKHAAWKALDDCIGQPKFQSLELVEVLGFLPSASKIPPQHFRTEIASRLPGVLARGIMKVHAFIKDA